MTRKNTLWTLLNLTMQSKATPTLLSKSHVQGNFTPKKLKELGVPVGELWSKLQAGQEVRLAWQGGQSKRRYGSSEAGSQNRLHR